jgi:hypothetical protein
MHGIVVPRDKPAAGGSLTIWQLRPGAAAWARMQAIKVPIQYGSSG